jgi:peptidoglycan/LPS O-acetylase OafA/YrhL
MSKLRRNGVASQEVPQHLTTVDSLRGFAAMSVCLFHLTGEGMPKFTEPTLRALFQWGWAGVDVFFVISGFIIPLTMLRSGYRLGAYGNFLGRRLFRVGPPSWVLVGLTVATFFAIDNFRGDESYWSKGLGWWRIFHNLAYTVEFTDYLWINPVFWTLAVEFQFYVLIGLVMPFAFHSLSRFLVVALPTLLLHYAPLPDGIVFFDHVALFLIGGAALLYFEAKVSLGSYLALVGGLSVAAALQVGPTQAVFGCGTALVISFARTNSPVGAFLGRISYSLYLVHGLVGALTASVLGQLLPPLSFLPKLIIILAAVAASLAAAWLFHLMVERPSMRLAHRTFRSSVRREPAL